MSKTTQRMIYGRRTPGRPKRHNLRPDKPLREYTKSDVWREGERLAGEMLESKGLELIERNWRCKAGEADIVAMEDGTVVLVEVKSRIGSPDDEVYPELAVDEEKIGRYEIMLKYFMAQHPDVHNARFDVVAVNLVSDSMAKVRHIVSAVSWDD